MRGFPFSGAGTILAIQNSLFVAGLPHGMVRSPDQGKTWHSCWTEQTAAPISCLVASPNFNRDRVVLAGTDGDGILRSTDGGRFWHLENFGLRTFSILSMATAPFWGRREVIFAGTDAGIYQSPNGGRAWRPIGEELADKRVTALLVSPNFSEDMTLFAGTERHGLYQSKDGGLSWELFPLTPSDFENINCLLLAREDELLVGTGTDGILRAKTDGSSCEVVAPMASPVFCLMDSGDQLFAGSSEGGFLSSTNSGETWKSEPGLNARRFNWLSVADESTLLAAGVTEGVWISRDAGAHWEETLTDQEDLIPLDVAVSHASFWLGAANGVLVSRDKGATWQQTLPSEMPISAIACAEERVWAGTESGQLLVTKDDGATWLPLDIPTNTPGRITLAVSPEFIEDPTLVAALTDEMRKRVQLWRSTDGGDHWHLWLDERTDWQAVRLSLNGLQAQESTLALGTKFMRHDGDRWQASEITTAEAPISALLTTPDPRLILAAVADEMLFSKDGEDWQKFSQGMEGASIVALQRSPKFTSDGTVWGLSTEGEIWKCLLA
jgi:photosystem II stability/assembly factor-like uncharacterized protein